MIDGKGWRKTSQRLAPATHTPSAVGHYDLHPGFPVGPGKIGLGFEALADLIAGQTQVILDGCVGVTNEHRTRLREPGFFTARRTGASRVDLQTCRARER